MFLWPVERALWLLCSLRWSLFPEVVRIHNFSKHVVYLYFVDYCVLSLCLHITVSRIDDVYQTHQVHPSDNIRETSEKRAPQSWEGLIPGPRGPSWFKATNGGFLQYGPNLVTLACISQVILSLRVPPPAKPWGSSGNAQWKSGNRWTGRIMDRHASSWYVQYPWMHLQIISYLMFVYSI